MEKFEKGKLIYANPLSCESNVADFVREGDVAITFPNGRMRMKNAFDRCEEKHQSGNFNIWCPTDFPDNISVSWDFRPLTDAGLAMFWISAKGRKGEDLFDPTLAPRKGLYNQYHHGDINALHLAYYRRNPNEIAFRTCNLRKSYGFHLVCQSGDPLPDAKYATTPYRIEVIKHGPHLRFSINETILFHWIDDESTGPMLIGGKIGFRQMAGLIAEYADMKVHEVKICS
ncbi:MAG TPA: DUF1961 family protein [Victivallales bacterium]|nr:DUF1961 family protein [Victivallales bacterium]